VNKKRLRLASLSLAACAALVLTGCGSDDAPPTDLGAGVVTPGNSSSAPGPSAVPVESSAPSASPSTAPSASPRTTSSASPRTGPSSAAAPRDAAATLPAPVRDDDAQVDAENQSGQGRTVRVKEAQLSRSDGFVAVYAVEGNRLLGSGGVERANGGDDDSGDDGGDDGGDDSGDDDGGDDDDDRSTIVRLDRPLSDTTRLLIVLHSDDGNGRFDAAKDPRVADDDDDNELAVDRITYRVG
jgi:hypothetical protein